MGMTGYFLLAMRVLLLWAASNALYVAAEFKFLNGLNDTRPSYVVVGYGEDFVVNCTTNDLNAVTFLYRELYNPPDGKMQWQPLLPGPKKITKNGQVYKVEKFDRFDYGNYLCNATNSKGESIQWMVSTNLVDKDSVVNSIKLKLPESATILVGSSVYFSCTAKQKPHSLLKWLKLFGNHYVPVSRGFVQECSRPFGTACLQLTIKNARVNNTGSYRCRVSYYGRESHRDARLTVLHYQAPAIVGHSGLSTGSVEVLSPKKISIYCIAEGFPFPTIRWYRKGQEIIASRCNDTLDNPCKAGTKYWTSLKKLASNKTVTSTLTILQNVFPDDYGSYTCVATSTKSDATGTMFVNVLASPKISTHGETKITLGTSFNETCYADGNPLPDVVWTRTDDPNREVLRSGKGKAVLVMKKVQEKDLGNYTCNATNIVTSVVALLTLKDKEDKVVLYVQEMPELIVIGIICGCVLFTFIVVIICFVLYRRQQKQYKLLYFMKMGNANYVIDPDRSLLEQCNNLPYDLDWEFPEERLILGEPLGSGAFGQVLKAEAIGMPAFKPRDKSAEAKRLRSKLRSSRRKFKDRQNSAVTARQTVAVKTLLDEASESDYKDLASELKILIHLGEHKNIVNVLGACTRGRRLMVIIEYAPHGDLLSFLRGKRDIYDANWVKTSNDPEHEFTLVDLSVAAYQVSRGMEFLASKKCVHRDLAARNVLVGENYVMKISDFGLARDIYQDDLYIKTTTGLLPVKWMAMESLFDRVYTEKSDVWSFGVVLWEMFTLGGCPYHTVPLEALVDFLNNGHRMDQPAQCPPEMYHIMMDCWRRVPDHRPTFAELNAEIKRITKKNAPKGSPLACYLEEVREPVRASNEYLTSAESVPSSARSNSSGSSLPYQATKGTNKSEDLCKNAAVSANGILAAESSHEENLFSPTERNGLEKGEKKPLLEESSLSSDQKKYINQHESSV